MKLIGKEPPTLQRATGLMKKSLAFFTIRKLKLYHFRCENLFETIKTLTKDITSRDRPKSAPYPRLKNSKKDFQVSSILFYSTRKFLSQLKGFCRKTSKN